MNVNVNELKIFICGFIACQGLLHIYKSFDVEVNEKQVKVSYTKINEQMDNAVLEIMDELIAALKIYFGIKNNFNFIENKDNVYEVYMSYVEI